MADTAAHHLAHQADDSASIDHFSSVILPAGQHMAGRSLPAMDNLLDADGAASPGRAAAPAEDPRNGLTRRRRSRLPTKARLSPPQAPQAAFDQVRRDQRYWIRCGRPPQGEIATLSGRFRSVFHSVANRAARVPAFKPPNGNRARTRFWTIGKKWC